MASNGDFSSIKAEQLKGFMPDLKTVLFNQLCPNEPERLGISLLKKIKTVKQLLSKYADIEIAKAIALYSAWQDKVGDKNVTYGALKEVLEKLDRKDIIKKLADNGIGDTHNNTEVDDGTYLEVVAKNLCPKDVGNLGIFLLGDYSNILKILEQEKPDRVVASVQALEIVEAWIKNNPTATADTLMDAVRKLEKADLTKDVHKLLIEIRNGVKQPYSKKTNISDADTPDGIADRLPDVPGTNPGQLGANIEKLGKELDSLKDPQPS